MPQKTSIEWTDYSSNLLMTLRKSDGKRGWACTKVSPGCDHCYSEAINKRFGTGLAYTPENEALIDFAVSEKELEALRKFKKTGSKVFVCDMTDLFHRKVTDEMLDRIFEVFEMTPHIIKQVLTKRPHRMRAYLAKRWGDKEPPSHVWLGVSVEAEKEKWRIELLQRTPAAVRFLSVEPLIEDIGEIDLVGISQLIVGGESGVGARPFDLRWAESIKNQCEAAGIPVFIKQLGSNSIPPQPKMKSSKGGDWTTWPESLRVRQFPVVA
jgi:protein gp37